MSERVSFPEPMLNDWQIGGYVVDSLEHIRNGETTWLQRNFSSDSGRVLDLYVAGQHVGFIEEDSNDGLCVAYINARPGIDEGPQPLTPDPVSLEEAAKALL